MYVCMHACMHGWMHVWMDAWMHACMHAHTDIAAASKKHQQMCHGQVAWCMGYTVIPPIMEFVYTVYTIPINRWITIPKYGQSTLTMRHQNIALFLVGYTTWFIGDNSGHSHP